ncbi:hypothetical protein [Streptomyces sp. NPDC018059]|uniref:hypothetical protein n=1 Tax=Streptomyces sp. NPDC018059 TaxID=3365041 RepID=UPI003795243D
MTDDLSKRRRGRPSPRTPGAPVPPAGPPAWVRTFVIPRNACDPCARHHHHRCHGVDVLRDPVPDCPCDCGDPHDPFRLNARAWADLALHAPHQVWIAAMFDRQRTAGLHTCSWRDDNSGLHAARPE